MEKIIFLFIVCTLLFVNSSQPYTVSSKLLRCRGGSSDNHELSSMDWRFFVAGGVAAACSHGWTTPIDVVKTKMQTDPNKYNQGVLKATKDIVAEEGFSFLLAGLAPTIVGYGLEGALKFGFYETFKEVFKGLTKFKFINLLAASVIAGAVASIVLCPMEETRIKMVGDATWSKENLVSGIARLMRESGVFSSFNGLPAMLSKQVPYTMGKQVSFDIITSMLYKIAEKFAFKKSDIKWFISVTAAFLASILACLSSQPGDMILTATYKGSGGHSHGPTESTIKTSETGFFNIIQMIHDQHGFGGFYLGTQARLAHVASIITSQLVIYDIVRIVLGLQATGSH